MDKKSQKMDGPNDVLGCSHKAAKPLYVCRATRLAFFIMPGHMILKSLLKSRKNCILSKYIFLSNFEFSAPTICSI